MEFGKMSYTQIHITDALLRLLEKKKFEDINISEIVNTAGVGRASFYRNYTDKESVLNNYLKVLMEIYNDKMKSCKENEWLYQLATTIYQNKKFFLIINKSGHLHLLAEYFLTNLSGVSNVEAYFRASIFYGTYGFLSEWIKRGLQETPDEIVMLIATPKQ